VPVSRVDIRPRRDAPAGAALRARARVRSGGDLPPAGLGGYVGPVRVRQSRPGGTALRGDAGRAALDRCRERPRPGHRPLPLPLRVPDRVELEGRAGELSRVLSLSDSSPGVQQGRGREPRFVQAPGAPDVLEPDRAGASLSACGGRQGALRTASRRDAGAVPLRLPLDDGQHRPRHPQHLSSAGCPTGHGGRWR
jgi:hypothetical protein